MARVFSFLQPLHIAARQVAHRTAASTPGTILSLSPARRHRQPQSKSSSGHTRASTLFPRSLPLTSSSPFPVSTSSGSRLCDGGIGRRQSSSIWPVAAAMPLRVLAASEAAGQLASPAASESPRLKPSPDAEKGEKMRRADETRLIQRAATVPPKRGAATNETVADCRSVSARGLHMNDQTCTERPDRRTMHRSGSARCAMASSMGKGWIRRKLPQRCVVACDAAVCRVSLSVNPDRLELARRGP